MCNEGLVHKRLLVNKNIFMALADRSDIFWKKLPERRARDLRMALADFSVASWCFQVDIVNSSINFFNSLQLNDFTFVILPLCSSLSLFEIWR